MKLQPRTSYQIWHCPLDSIESNAWRPFTTIPPQRTQEEAEQLLSQFLRGEYKPQQLKPWLKKHGYKIIKTVCKYEDVSD